MSDGLTVVVVVVVVVVMVWPWSLRCVSWLIGCPPWGARLASLPVRLGVELYVLSCVEFRVGSLASDGVWEWEDLERPGRRHLDFLSLGGSMI